MRAPCLALAVCWVAAAPHARADEPEEPAQALFHDATNRLAAGEEQRATELLLDLVDRFPGDALADDALFLAGQVFEDKLSDPARAHQTYRRLLESYPNSRSAIAAERRAERLAGSIASGHADALAEFMELLRLFPEKGEAWSVHRAGEILAAHPDWNERARVHLWLGRVHARAGRAAAALRHYHDAQTSPDSGERFEATLGAALSWARLGDFSAAEKVLADADTEELPPRVRALEDTASQVARDHLRERLFHAALAVLALCALGLTALVRISSDSWSQAAHRLARPPAEAVYLMPIAALLIAISLTGHRDIGPAVTIVAAGGVAVTWLSGCGLRSGAGRGRGALHAALAGAAVVALTYVALHRNHLIDMIVETVRFGPDV